MTSLVHELQAMAQSEATTLPELLRSSKVVAAKLGLHDAVVWIDYEIKGYPPNIPVPKFRVVPSELRADNPMLGSIPVEFAEQNWVWERFSRTEVRDSIAEIAEHAKGSNSTLRMSLIPPELNLLRRISETHRLPLYRLMSRTSMTGILGAIRSQVLDWALSLEQQGILGVGMSFTSQEKERAVTSVTINNGPVIHGNNAQVASSDSGSATVAPNSQIGAVASGAGALASGQVQQAQLNDLVEVRRLVEVLLSELKGAKDIQGSDVIEHGVDLQEEVAKEKPKPSKVKAILGAIGGSLPAIIKVAPRAVEAFEKIKHLLGG